MIIRVKPNLLPQSLDRFRRSLIASCIGVPIFVTETDSDRSYSILMREGSTDEQWDEMLSAMDECVENELKPMLEIR